MNLQEREQLTTFLQQLAQAQLGFKDEEAQAMIANTFAGQADAAYLVVQRAVMLDAALRGAEAQIAQLKAQLERQRPGAPASGFLDATTWGRPASPVGSPPAMTSPAVQPAPLAAPSPGFQVPSFLSNVATTAAGVAAGAFLFQGINHLVDGHHHSSLFGANPLSSPAAESATSTINNFFDPPADASGGSADNSAGFDELLDIGRGDSSDWT
ncbi:DUF2076 domain-containing protein [Polaromonas jejuensis]|uniref:DUF2076 domain-containing protein n=1 Tax=Polaromonas jejuensis TaxID=457502 RepID=A0ABW0Q3U9_9BURK|nr:DUF2076 family protein [Polaromonas jejuensis]